MAFKDWSTTAGDNDDADAAINWSEGQAPSTVNGSARAMMSVIKKAFGHVVSVNDYGAAGDDSTDDTTAIQDAIDAVYTAGGGTVQFGNANFTYKITSALVIGSNVTLDLCGCSIKQYTSDTPCIQVTKASLNDFWEIKNGELHYDTQQTSSETDAFGIRIATTSVNSYNGRIQNIKVTGGYGAVDLPELTGCTAFFVTLDNVVANQCAGYGFDISGASSGARTNITLRQCWVVQTSGSEISTSRGFRIRRIQGLVVTNCGVDHVQNNNVFELSTCQGVIQSASVESCDISLSSGTGSYFNFSGCHLDVGLLTAVDNNVTISGSADFVAVRPPSGTSTRLRVGIFQDLNTTVTDSSSGAYYTTSASSTEEIYIERYRKTGSTPTEAIAEFGIHKYVRYFDGSWRMRTDGGKVVVWGSSAPASETWSVGDRLKNTAPSAGEPDGWVCTSGGTPGTWLPFGYNVP